MSVDQMTLLTQAAQITKNAFPDEGHMLPHEGDFSSFDKPPETMVRTKSSEDLRSRGAKLIGSDASYIDGAYRNDEGTIEYVNGNAETNNNNDRVAARIERDKRNFDGPSTTRQMHNILNGGPLPSEVEHPDHPAHTEPLEGGNRDENGGVNIGARSDIAPKDETPPPPPTNLEWKPNA